MVESTDPHIAELATQTGRLPLDRLQVIGVAGSAEDRRALLRSEDGQIETVHVGDSVQQGTVVAIDDDAVILSHNGTSEILHMPRAPRAAA